MRALIQRVDRLQRLGVFESAARLGGFSPAARELGISQPAVTRQIRSLERSLDVTLFERTANRSSLTPAGQHLVESLDHSFGAIEFAIDEITRSTDLFVLAAPPGFAQQLIVPHLDVLADLVPDCDLRLWLYDRDDELNGGVYDLAVRVGEAEWQGFDTVDLFPESIVPVAAPALATTLGLHAGSAAAEVIAAPLLHAEAEGRPWASWDDWADAFGLTFTQGRRRVTLNNYPTVLHQALAGRGIALGWRGIVDDLLSEGLLVEVGPGFDTKSRYAVSWPSGANTPAVAATVDWLQHLVATSLPPPHPPTLAG